MEELIAIFIHPARFIVPVSGESSDFCAIFTLCIGVVCVGLVVFVFVIFEFDGVVDIQRLDVFVHWKYYDGIAVMICI